MRLVQRHRPAHAFSVDVVLNAGLEPEQLARTQFDREYLFEHIVAHKRAAFAVRADRPDLLARALREGASDDARARALHAALAEDRPWALEALGTRADELFLRVLLSQPRG